MRVVTVGPDVDVMGGISFVLIEYLKSGIQQRIDFIFIPTTKDGSILYKSLFFIKSLLIISSDLMKGKKTIFHLHVSQNGSFYRKLIVFGLAKITKNKVISHIHGSRFESFMKEKAINRILVRAMLNNSDLVITLSEVFKSVVSTFAIKAKVEKVYNPIQLPENFDKDDSKHLTVLFLGRLSNRKGTFDLLDAVKQNRVYFYNKNVKFVIAGDGHVDKVNDYVSKNELNDIVDVPGWISGTRKETLLENADLFILPSYKEQMPMSILEAMAHRLPIISTYVAGIPEMVENNKNGLLIEPGDINSLSSAIKDLLEDDERRLKMGRESYQRVLDKFEGKIIVDDLISIYNSL